MCAGVVVGVGVGGVAGVGELAEKGADGVVELALRVGRGDDKRYLLLDQVLVAWVDQEAGDGAVGVLLGAEGEDQNAWGGGGVRWDAGDMWDTEGVCACWWYCGGYVMCVILPQSCDVHHTAAVMLLHM